MPVMKRDEDCSFERHPDESRDPALCHVDLTWIPVCAGMTVLASVRGIRPEAVPQVEFCALVISLRWLRGRFCWLSCQEREKRRDSGLGRL